MKAEETKSQGTVKWPGGQEGGALRKREVCSETSD